MGWLWGIKKLSPLEGYNRWARSYHRESNPIKTMSDDFISNHLPSLNGKSVLDAGCGTGKFCTIAAEQGAAFVKGLDLSPWMIDEAKKNCPSATLECSDLGSASIETKRYDVIICALVLGHIPKSKPVVLKLIDGLRTGGRIIVTDFHPEQTLRRAKRTFRDSLSGKVYEIAHTGHPIDEYLSIFGSNGLDEISLEEPGYNGSRAIFGISAVKS